MILKKQLTFRDLCNNILRYSEGEVREEIVQGWDERPLDVREVMGSSPVGSIIRAAFRMKAALCLLRDFHFECIWRPQDEFSDRTE